MNGFNPNVIYGFIYDNLDVGELDLDAKSISEWENQRRVTFYRDHKNYDNHKTLRDYPDNPAVSILDFLHQVEKRISFNELKYIIELACAFKSAKKGRAWGYKYMALLELFKEKEK